MEGRRGEKERRRRREMRERKRKKNSVEMREKRREKRYLKKMRGNYVSTVDFLTKTISLLIPAKNNKDS